MKQLLIATHNPSKLKELTEGLQPLVDKGIKVLSLKDVGITEEPEENGKTCIQNSLLKAEFYGNLSGLPVIADDGGLCIEILNGEPGVKSKRWMGRDATDDELISFTLEKMKGIPPEKRTAHMELVLTFFDPKTKVQLPEIGIIEGRIAERPYHHYSPGFPFRAVFIVDQFNKYYDELTPAEHDEVNHRLIALRNLTAKIENYLLQ